jgi:hypothetical protein
MNDAGGNVKGEKAQQPKNDQNRSNDTQHGCISFCGERGELKA